MEIFGQIVMLLAGCGVFMLGFKLLSEHMEKLAGNGLKSFFNKISNNKFYRKKEVLFYVYSG